MGINIEDFRHCVIHPTLTKLGVHQPSAEHLLLATAIVESGLGSILRGSAHRTSGIYQLHGVTHRHIWDDYLSQRPDMASLIRGLASQRDFLQYPHAELMTNMSYATAITWLAYRRHHSFSLSAHADIAELADCWKRFYHPRKDLSISDFISGYQGILGDDMAATG